MLKALLVSLALTSAVFAADPIKIEGDYVVKDFKFTNGAVLPEVKLHYTTLGDPKNEAVLVLHGTAGSGTGMLAAPFGGQLFGEGQPLDATKYYIILPDALGTGKSTKPSDGLKAQFPAYNYTDMVEGHYRLVSEHLKVKHLRLVIGNSMGGMQTWMWAQKYPAMMDVAVPMASLPTAMSGRNWMLRRMLTQSIRLDPEWEGGNYTKQPKSLIFALTFFNAATIGGNQGLQKLAPTSDKADELLKSRLAAVLPIDANDQLYQWESSKDYDASKGLEAIKASLFVINSADDERNPPELGILEKELPRVKNAKLLLIPGSPETAGHGTTGQAKFWAKELDAFLKTAPKL